MATLRTFRGLRPKKELAEQVAAFPYDVINSKEAREIAKGNPYSFLHVGKSEIDLPESVDIHDRQVYEKARDNLQGFIRDGILVQDSAQCLYIYKQRMGNHEQYGLVGCFSAEEYDKNVIKKHEFTRKDKEDDRTMHTLTINANAGPVFLCYRDQKAIDTIIATEVKKTPACDFVKEDGIQHTVWVIDNPATQAQLTSEFKKLDSLYIADGHHRSASAARAAKQKLATDPNPSREKEYNFFLAVAFPASQLMIMDYNRVLLSMNGNTKETLFTKIKEKFDIIGEKTEATPKHQKEFGMYIDHTWYQLRAKEGSYPANDPIRSLDVSILQENLLAPIFDIQDPRTDKKIDFVGGIRGNSELEKRVNSGEGKVAFRLYPTTIDQLMSVADVNQVMPPKSTWFEPKLRSGLIVHLLD